MKNRKILGLLIASILLSACESIPFFEKTSDYKGSGRAKPLEVPPDLVSNPASDVYSVPGGSTTFSTYNQATGSEEVGVEKVLATPESVRMVKAGSQRWLVVQASPEKIWPSLREFWLDQGFAVRMDSPEAGVMETEWVKASDIKAKDDKQNYLDKFDQWLDELSGLADRRKFRTRLERGEQDGTTEIYMTHRTVAGAPDDGKTRVRTQLGDVETGYKAGAKSGGRDERMAEIDNDLDAELLQRLMVKLGIDQKRAEQVATNPVVETRAQVTKESDSSVTLTLNDSFDRGWRRVGLALDRIGFVIEDKDRSNGLYFVSYTDVDIDGDVKKKKGLLDTLSFWKDDPEAKAVENKSKPKNEKTVVDKLKFWKGDEGKTDPSKQYRIRVAETENGTTRVNVVDADNNRNRTTTANRIVALMYEQLK